MDAFARAFHQAKRLLGVGQKEAAHLGQGDLASAAAFEQAHAEFLLQGLDLAGEGWLAEVQLPGGAAEGEQFGHRDKGVQMPQFHNNRV